MRALILMFNGLNSALLRFSGVAFGSRIVPSEEVDAAFGMPVGKLRYRAGILSLAYAAVGESEVTLGATAASDTLRNAQVSPEKLDWIIASSETHRAIPSLAAQLHAALGGRETCGALDVGGACLGLVHALVVAKSFVESGQAGTVLVVTADVHSRTLTPGRVAGEFWRFVWRRRRGVSGAATAQRERTRMFCTAGFLFWLRFTATGGD